MASVEHLVVNFTNPDPALGELRSTVEGGRASFLAKSGHNSGDVFGH